MIVMESPLVKRLVLGLLMTRRMRHINSLTVSGIGEDIMTMVNETMTHLVVGGGLMLMVIGAWALVQEVMPGILH